MKLGENHVDEIICLMKGTPEESAIVGFHPLSVRMGCRDIEVGVSLVGGRRTDNLKD
jgi:hypothetical protein